MMANRTTMITIAIVVVAVILSGLLGYYVSTMNSNAGSSPKAAQSSTVSLDVMPDWGGAGYDAFVLASNVNGNIPAPATNSTGPGVNNNNITVSTGSTVQFVITSTDTAVNANFTNQVVTPFVLYNDTNSGQVAISYNKGEFVTNMPVGHTFTITSLNINIPIPPTTIVTFTYTFTTAGVYKYQCETPCGPGMGLNGYMTGYIIVK